jgi:excisionase family DNA binding protein
VSAELAALAADPQRVADLRPDAIPDLVGELEALRARLWVRLQAPPAAPAAESNGADPDTLLTAQQAADRLGVSKRWMYAHADTLPFTKRLTGGTVRFSSRGLDRWKGRR